MASQRVRPSRGGKRTVPHLAFSLRSFEEKLRAAIQWQCDRKCGKPGSTEPDFTGSTSRALKSLLLSHILSKYDPGTGGEQRKAAAMVKFWTAEERCYWMNWRFSQPIDLLDRIEPRLKVARELILKLLGPEVPLEEIARGFGHGPGATTRLPRSSGDAVYKYSTDVEVTPNALPVGQAAILAQPMWKRMFALGEDGSVPLRTVFGNRVTTVPKNYKTDRVIAIEPDLNMYVQKGLGAVIRRRLKKVGVDLDDQRLNQVAARDLTNATIDFSMASDLVSQGIVSCLLPPNWCDLIASMRSEFGMVEPVDDPEGPAVLHRYSKVSSMGNGFTFELESLIFWALAAACVPPSEHCHIRVYGDDVILPQHAAAPFMELSEFCGFIPNLDKSFVDGPFRESCGKHYFNGCDISPFYIKRPVTTLSDLFLLHNNLWRWLRRADALLTPAEYSAVKKLLRDLRYLAPARWRKPSLPDGYGDDAFIGTFAECEPRTSRDGWETFECPVLSLTPPDGYIEVPDGGIWVKADKILRQRQWILPLVTVLDVASEPAQKGRRRRGLMAVPWWAWG